MVSGAYQPLAQALAFGPILGFQSLAQVADSRGAVLTPQALSLAAEFVNGFSFYVAPDARAGVDADIEFLRGSTVVSQIGLGKLSDLSRTMASLGIPEEEYFGRYMGTFESSGSRLLDRFLSRSSLTPRYIRQMRRHMLAMGIAPHEADVDEVRGNVRSYYGNSAFTLIGDLNARSRDTDIYREILVREGTRLFNFSDENGAKAGLGIATDNRTVSLRVDRETGQVTVSYMAGYYDARPIGYYGLPSGTEIGVPMPLQSGKGVAILTRLDNGGTSTETRLYHILPNDPAIGYDKLHRHLVRINEENLRRGKTDGVLQKTRRRTYAEDRDSTYWKTFYSAFHQYLAERGIIGIETLSRGRLDAEGFFFAPDTMEAGALTVFGRKDGLWTPIDGLSSSVQRRRSSIDFRLTFERPFRTEGGTFYPHLFAATIRPKGTM